MRQISVVCVSMVVASAISCGTIDVSTGSDYVIQLDENAPSGFRAILPDGTVFTDPERYIRHVSTIARERANAGLGVTFVVGDRSCAEYDNSSDYSSMGQCLSGGGPLPFGYYFSYQISGAKRINGCVNTVCNPGGTVRLHRNGNQLWDMHVGRFVRGGRTCLGMYESQSGWCINPCGPTYNEMRQGLRDAIVAVGVAATSAWLMAQAMAPFLAPALAL